MDDFFMNDGLMPFMGHITNGCRVTLNNALNLAELRCLMAPKMEPMTNKENLINIMTSLHEARKILSDFSALMLTTVSPNPTTHLESLLRQLVPMFQLCCFSGITLSTNGTVSVVKASPSKIMEILLGFLFEAWRDIVRVKEGATVGHIDLSIESSEPSQDYVVLKMSYPVSDSTKEKTEDCDESRRLSETHRTYLGAIGGHCCVSAEKTLKTVEVFFPVDFNASSQLSLTLKTLRTR